jgi:hypothetical protein
LGRNYHSESYFLYPHDVCSFKNLNE